MTPPIGQGDRPAPSGVGHRRRSITSPAIGLRLVGALAIAGILTCEGGVTEPPNHAPGPVGTIPDQAIEADSAAAVDVTRYFADPDSDTLTYAATSASTATATVTMSGGVATMTGVAKGETTVTVTARDPEGLTAEQGVKVTVPNRAPESVGTIADLEVEVDTVGSVPDDTVNVGEPVSFDIARYFTDPDGDDLEYSARSSNPATARVGVEGSTLTLVGRAAGTATISVTSLDPAELSAHHEFVVTVVQPNRAPRPVGTIPEQTVDVGGSVSIDVTPYFSDPDHDNLDYSAESSDDVLAKAGASDSLVEVTGHLKGRVTITVTAEDPGGLTATQDFEVEVPNQQPLVAAEIDDLTAFSGRTHRVLLSEVFWDPDGDPLTYAAWSADSAVARPEVVADTVFVTADSDGFATLAVTATDPDSLFAADTFEVTVVVPLFDLALGFTGDVTETTRSRIREARDEWEAFLWNTELNDVEVTDPVVCLGLSADDVGTVDDHLALVHVGSIDGEGGTLAYAGYCYRRKSDSLPIVSAAVFDEADIDRMLSTESLAMVAFHELAHGLGFNRSIWRLNELLDDGDDPHFKGELAIEAFEAAGGADYPDAKVPISSPDYSHWRESVFEREVMTPRMTLGEANPFSAITLQAMTGVGYVVDVSLADDYELPGTAPPPGAGEEYAEGFDLSNDVVRGPVMVLDSDGRVIRVIPAPPGSVVPSFSGRDVRIEPRGPTSRAGGGLDRQAPARETMWKRVINRPSVRRSR